MVFIIYNTVLHHTLISFQAELEWTTFVIIFFSNFFTSLNLIGKRSIFQIFWKVHFCAKFLFIKLQWQAMSVGPRHKFTQGPQDMDKTLKFLSGRTAL